MRFVRGCCSCIGLVCHQQHQLRGQGEKFLNPHGGAMPTGSIKKEFSFLASSSPPTMFTLSVAGHARIVGLQAVFLKLRAEQNQLPPFMILRMCSPALVNWRRMKSD